eukprot:COSAG01_NODE_515_length_16042_cov_8.646553_11_plen_71_part_00
MYSPELSLTPGLADHDTWPESALKDVSLLGSNETLDFAFSDTNGLTLSIKAGMQVAAPFVAIFKLDFSPE